MENNAMEIPERIEGCPNYPYSHGCLEGRLLAMTYSNIPGVKVTDERLFRAYIQKTLNEIHNQSVKYNRGEI